MFALNKTTSMPNILRLTRQQILEEVAVEVGLSLIGCSLIDIEPNSFSTLYHLKSLSLAWNKCQCLTREKLNGLRNLEKLSMDCCSITSIEPDTFVEMARLRILDLSWNRIVSLNKFQLSGLKSVVKLDLHQCCLNYIESDTFTEMSSLRKLDMSFNHFDVLEKFSGRQLLVAYSDRQCFNIDFSVCRSTLNENRQKS